MCLRGWRDRNLVKKDGRSQREQEMERKTMGLICSFASAKTWDPLQSLHARRTSAFPEGPMVGRSASVTSPKETVTGPARALTRLCEDTRGTS